uniref:Transcription initiation factor TFIID subunit 4 n=1 Tax=Panagrellus redivivus TaxID=6233 RepID=A0A7E4VD93_PANRE
MSTPSVKGPGTPKAPVVQIVRVDEASISDSEALPQVPDKTNPVSLKVGDKNVKDSVANPPSAPDENSSRGSDQNSSKEAFNEKDKPKPVAILSNQANPIPPVSQCSSSVPSSSNGSVSVTGSESVDTSAPTVVSIGSNGAISSSSPSSTPLNTLNPSSSSSAGSSLNQSVSWATSKSAMMVPDRSAGSPSYFKQTGSSSGSSSGNSSAGSSTTGNVSSLTTDTSSTPQKQQPQQQRNPQSSSLSTSMSSYVSKNLEDLGATFIVHPKETANYIVNQATDTLNNIISLRPWSDFRAKHQKQVEEDRKNRDRGPLATSTPRSSSKARTIPVSSEGRSVGSIRYKKSDSTVPSLSLSARAFTPSECSDATDATTQEHSNSAFDETDETHASRIRNLLEYVINNVKNLDRVERIRISIERSFPEIKEGAPVQKSRSKSKLK